MKFLPTPTAPSNWLVGQREARLVHCPSASWDQRPLSSCPGSSASTVGASLGFGSHCARWRQRLRSTSSAPDDWTSGSLDPSQRRTVPGFDPSAYTDEVRSRVEAAVQKKIEGQEITMAEAAGPGAQVIDLMEALRASLEKKPAKRAQPAKPAARKVAKK